MNKEQKYTRDSVLGNAKVDPIHYKNDTMVQVKMDARKIVELDKFLESNGIQCGCMADIVRESVDIILEYAHRENMIEYVEFSKSAYDYLKFKYNRRTLNQQSKRCVVHNLTLDDRKEERQVLSKGFSSRPSSKISDEEWDRIQERIKEDEKQEALERVKESITNQSSNTINPEFASQQVNKNSIRKVEKVREEKAKSDQHMKLSEQELLVKEEEIYKRDQEQSKAWSNIDQSQLTPIKGDG